MSTSTRPAWSDDCFKPQPERHYKGKRPSRRLVEGNSARTTSVVSIVTQDGVHPDEAADWLGLGRRRDPGNAPLAPPATRSLREALEARAAPTHAAGQSSVRKSMREPAERYQRELPPPPVAPPSEPDLPKPPPPPPPALTQTDSRRLGRRHFGGARTRPEGLLVWDESATKRLCARGHRRPRGYRYVLARALRHPRTRHRLIPPWGASSVGTARCD